MTEKPPLRFFLLNELQGRDLRDCFFNPAKPIGKKEAKQKVCCTAKQANHSLRITLGLGPALG